MPLGLLNLPYPMSLLYGDTDKHAHGYLPYYRRHLGPRRLRKNLIIEIGVGSPEGDPAGYRKPDPGGSLYLWRDYFCRSNIVGVDLYEKQIRLGPRVRFIRADQSSPAELQNVIDQVGNPDVVIDDGSHIGEHIVTTFRTLFPSVAPGGVYVIEDLATSYYASHRGGHPPPPISGIGLLQSLVSSVQASDTTFERYPEWGPAPTPELPGVRAVHVYPGIAFIEKDRSQP